MLLKPLTSIIYTHANLAYCFYTQFLTPEPSMTIQDSGANGSVAVAAAAAAAAVATNGDGGAEPRKPSPAGDEVRNQILSLWRNLRDGKAYFDFLFPKLSNLRPFLYRKHP